MHTTCPHCSTLFSVSQVEIDTAEGQVICSVCSTQFNAQDSLQDVQTAPIHENVLSQPKTLIAFLIVISILLPLQYLYFKKDALLKQPTTRSIAEVICSIAPCKLPQFKDPSQIQLINRKVHSHPVEKSALIITATVVNNAPLAQPFPKILIGMADIHGTVHAQRLFDPIEYLPENITAEQNMAAGIPLNINIEINDPGQNLIAFEIDFL